MIFVKCVSRRVDDGAKTVICVSPSEENGTHAIKNQYENPVRETVNIKEEIVNITYMNAISFNVLMMIF